MGRLMVKRVLIQRAHPNNEEKLILDMIIDSPVDCVVFELEDGRSVMVQPTAEGLYVERRAGKYWDLIEWRNFD